MRMPPWNTARPRSAARPRQSRSQGVSRAMCSMPRRVSRWRRPSASSTPPAMQLARLALQAHVQLVARQRGAELQVDAAIVARREPSTASVRAITVAPAASSCTRACSSCAPRPRWTCTSVVGQVRVRARREVVLDQGQRARRRAARPGGAGARPGRRPAAAPTKTRCTGAAIAAPASTRTQRAFVASAALRRGEGFVGAVVAAAEDTGVARDRPSASACDKRLQAHALRAGRRRRTAPASKRPLTKTSRGAGMPATQRRVAPAAAPAATGEAARRQRAQRGVLPALRCAGRAGRARKPAPARRGAPSPSAGGIAQRQGVAAAAKPIRSRALMQAVASGAMRSLTQA